MAGGFPLGLEVCNGQALVSNFSNSNLVFPQSGASANTKGPWSALTSSLPTDVSLLQVRFRGFESANGIMSFDIGVGGAGSEVVLIPDIVVYSNGTTQFNAIIVPVAIPGGTRVAVRYQDTATSAFNLGAGINVWDSAATNLEGYARVDALGWSGTASTSLTPGLQAWGSWTQIVASTSRDYAGFFVELDDHNTPDTTNFPNIMAELGIGAGGAEQVIIPDWIEFAGGNKINAWTDFIEVPVPAGTRIAARATASTAASTSGCGVVLYGVYQ